MHYEDVQLQPLKSHKVKVLKSFAFNGVTVPSGFISDGASVPRIFWSIFPPNRTDYLPCAILHDYLCDLEEYRVADEYFKDCLECLKVDRFSRAILYLSVRFYHKLRYRE